MLTHLYDCERQLSSEMRKKTKDGEQRAGNTDESGKKEETYTQMFLKYKKEQRLADIDFGPNPIHLLLTLFSLLAHSHGLCATLKTIIQPPSIMWECVKKTPHIKFPMFLFKERPL